MTKPWDRKDFSPERDLSIKDHEAYANGYESGRAGGKCPPDASEAFVAGFLEGEEVLEEAENGHDSRFDG